MVDDIGAANPAFHRAVRRVAVHREHCGRLTRAAFLSARNDALANIAIIAAAALAAFLWRAPWPDLVVGLGIAVIDSDADREVRQAARAERAVQ